jgi:hypothetical protein
MNYSCFWGSPALKREEVVKWETSPSAMQTVCSQGWQKKSINFWNKYLGCVNFQLEMVH